MSYLKIELTNQGKEYLEERLFNNEPLVFTELALSGHIYEKEVIVGLTDLENVQQVEKVTKLSQDMTNDQVDIQAVFSNANNTNGFTVQSIGLYVENPDFIPMVDEEFPEDFYDEELEEEKKEEKESNLEENPEETVEGEEIEEIESTKEAPAPEFILYGVAIAEEHPIYVEAPTRNSFTLTLNVTVGVGEAKEVTIIKNPSGTPTKEDVTELREVLENFMAQSSTKSDNLAEELSKEVANLSESDMMIMMALMEMSMNITK